MARAEIQAGACGFITMVKATAKGSRKVELSIESACAHITKLAAALNEVDAYKELSCRQGITPILAAGVEHCAHAACPVPAGIVKVVEVAANLALPRDATIHLTSES